MSISKRYVEINGEPWFVGKDVAEQLGYKDASRALGQHIDEEDKTVQVVPYGQNTKTVGKLTFINESGLYSLAFASKLSSAKRFKRWVTSEVLPSIRKHGAYVQNILSNNRA